MTQEPLYLSISQDELKQRTGQAKKILSSCALCPWDCGINRLEGQKGRCGAPAQAVMAGAGPHFGEETQLSGTRGSGTIFFAHCNLDCVFCQNWELSQQNLGNSAAPEQLAREMLKLQKQSCHNINLVTPTPHIPAILEALCLAVDEGLNLPLVYNCGGYEKVEVLRLLEGIIDIYMPDFKYTDGLTAARYSGPRDYPERCRDTLREMHRQVGDLKTGTDDIAYRGLMVRHLVLPDNAAGTEEALRFLAEEISPRTAVNIMDQYYPAFRAGRYAELNRPLTGDEYRQARKTGASLGLRLLR